MIGTRRDDNPVVWTGFLGAIGLRVDAEVDFHGFSRAGMVAWLEENWARPGWRGLRRVRVIHGKGEVLPSALRDWCDSRAIPWAPEAGNPGCTILHPALRTPSAASAIPPRRTRP